MGVLLSLFKLLIEPCQGLLPAIFGRSFTVAGAVVGMKRVRGVRVHNKFRRFSCGVALGKGSFHGFYSVQRDTGICASVQPKHRAI